MSMGGRPCNFLPFVLRLMVGEPFFICTLYIRKGVESAEGMRKNEALLLANGFEESIKGTAAALSLATACGHAAFCIVAFVDQSITVEF